VTYDFAFNDGSMKPMKKVPEGVLFIMESEEVG
jgi:hypothetical protein